MKRFSIHRKLSDRLCKYLQIKMWGLSDFSSGKRRDWLCVLPALMHCAVVVPSYEETPDWSLLHRWARSLGNFAHDKMTSVLVCAQLAAVPGHMTLSWATHSFLVLLACDPWTLETQDTRLLNFICWTLHVYFWLCDLYCTWYLPVANIRSILLDIYHADFV